MESKLKQQCQDSVGELYENMLLKEGGFPHLPNPVFVPEPKTKQAIVGLLENKSDAWNDAGTKPDHPCLCETRLCDGNIASQSYQYWTGKFFCIDRYDKSEAFKEKNRRKSVGQHVQWREVQS